MEAARSRFGWLGSAGRAVAERQLAAPMPRGREELSFRTPMAGLGEREVEGRRHVLLVSYYPNASLLKFAAALRDSGRYHLSLLACCLREDSEPLRFVHQCYEVADYKEMLQVLDGAAPAAVHVFIQPWLPAVLALDAARQTGARTVVHLNDSTLYMEPGPDTELCALERSILREADCFTHKMPPAGVDELRRTWGVDTPDACVHALPLRGFFAAPRPRGNGETLEMVFAGGVMPYHLAVARGHQNHIFDPLIVQAGEEGVRLTFYVNQNARNMYWDEHSRYVAMARERPGFSFRRGVPLHRLPAALAAFHYAVYYENQRESSYPPQHFLYNMATKIFSYLEAGLPILIPEGAVYICSLVEEHGLGLVYAPDRFAAAVRSCRSADHAGLAGNVARFRETHEMSSQLRVLDEVYATPAAAAAPGSGAGEQGGLR